MKLLCAAVSQDTLIKALQNQFSDSHVVVSLLLGLIFSISESVCRVEAKAVVCDPGSVSYVGSGSGRVQFLTFNRARLGLLPS